MRETSTAPVIVWFRQDLRLADNPALVAAAASGRPILPVYIHDDGNAGAWALGGASRWWLHRSLGALDAALGGSLICLSGPADRLIPELARRHEAPAVHVNVCVEPWRVDCDAVIERRLRMLGIGWHSHRESGLFDPAAVVKADGTPYRVFTPFWRKGCLGAATPPAAPLPVPRELWIHRAVAAAGGDAAAGPVVAAAGAAANGVDALGLRPQIPWYRGIDAAWTVGEAAAADRLDRFLDSGLRGYREGRNRPDLGHVSRLSPHLHFGEISPRQIWHAVLPRAADPALEADVDAFLSELGWREFSRYLLHYHPELPERNLQAKFDAFPWRSDSAALECWQQGRTGYPIVDAGMRELWQTGYMHNRVRMIVGSFLVKNLLIDWREGERWFWDTLVDADLASNSASWQWVAGSGADAAPYFRIFNPVTQGQKFDPDGRYVRRYLPELAHLPDDRVHEPWRAKQGAARETDWPEPIVDLAGSRARALAAFRGLSASSRSA